MSVEKMNTKIIQPAKRGNSSTKKNGITSLKIQFTNHLDIHGVMMLG